MDSIEVVIQSLTLLTVDELKKVRGRIDLLLSSKQNDNEPRTLELFYDEIGAFLKRKGMIIPSYFIMKKKMSKTYESLVIAHDAVNTYFLTIVEKPTLNQKIKLYGMYAEMIYNHITSQTNLYVLNIQTMLSFYQSFPTLMEQSFPGYLQEMGHLIFEE